MEETLGKRISANRKKLGLTQDKVAERLGVTAQAVSKWENDQACPDITTLPKLAEMFHISTDRLLGVTSEEETEDHPATTLASVESGTESAKDNYDFQFHWDGGRKHGIFNALTVLLVGGLLLAGRILGRDVSFWSLLWPSTILMYGIAGLMPDFPLPRAVCCLAGIYFLLDNIGLLPVGLPENLTFPVLVVILGLSMLADALKRDKHPHFIFQQNGENGTKTKYDCHTGDTDFSCSLSFGENTHAVELPLLCCGEASVSFGELCVDLLGCRRLSPDCTIAAHCSFGELEIRVPRRFRVIPNSSTSFASVTLSGHPDPEPEGILHLDANVSFGEIHIKYI